jgi:hypothetical protein
MELPIINYKISENTHTPINSIYSNATDGSLRPEIRTSVTIKREKSSLAIDFICEENPFSDKNEMKTDNQALYEQEVFELFIAAEESDPSTYLELEINPNGAIWAGKVLNLDLNGKISVEMIAQTERIKRWIKTEENRWYGGFKVPLDLLGGKWSSAYRLNFYRIRLNKEPEFANWDCIKERCDFLCWSPTYSGIAPAFHKPKKFGFLYFE